MEAAIGDKKDLAARFLAVDDPRDIDPSLADDVAAELDDHLAPAAAPA